MEDLVEHHLLEIILWPMPDGTFKEIRNSVERLEELGIYKEWKLTMLMPRGVHTSLHQKGVPSTEYEIELNRAARIRNWQDKDYAKRMSEAHKGKHPSEATLKKMSDSHKGKTYGPKGKHRVYREDGSFYYA